MIEALTDYFIKRRLNKNRIEIIDDGIVDEPTLEFRRVLNTLRENKVMVTTREDGIYIRLAGNENNVESFSDTFVRVKEFSKINTVKKTTLGLGKRVYYGMSLSESYNLEVVKINKIVDEYNATIDTFDTYDEQMKYSKSVDIKIDLIFKSWGKNYRV